MKYKYDFLIIGAGVAGMSYALKIARAKKGSSKFWRLEIILLTKKQKHSLMMYRN